MARANIAKMLGQQTSESPAAKPAKSEPANQTPPVRAGSTSSARSTSARSSGTTTATVEGDPSRELYKKGAVLYVDQLEALDAQARRLNQAKSSTELPRITANTLLRIAADLLLSRSGQMSGDDEQQLRKSVGL